MTGPAAPGAPPARVRRCVVTGDGPLASGVAAGLGGTVVRVGGDAFTSEAALSTALAGAARELGGLDLLVHAWVPGGLTVATPFAEIDEAAWAATCEAAIEGAWWLARQAIPPLLRSRGSMVFLVPTTGMAGGAGFSMLATYAEAARMLAKGCGRQLGTSGVTVNTVATAPHLWVGDGPGEELSRAITLSTAAFGRDGDAADDIAPLVSLLADDGAHFLTAATLTADGGTWMGL